MSRAAPITPPVTREAGDGKPRLPELEAFLLALGRGLVLAGAPVSQVQERLVAVAKAYGAPRARILAFPTFFQVVVEPGRATMTELTRDPNGTLRLDQVTALYELVRRAEAAQVPPAKGPALVARIIAMRRPHGIPVIVAGYVVVTIGVSLLLRSSPSDLLLAALLSPVVVALRLLGARWDSLRTILPALAALLVAGLAFLAVDLLGVHADLRAVIAPLVTLLPGVSLTMGVLEVSAGDLVTGSSRLIGGMLQLLLLAFGILAAAHAPGAPGAPRLVGHPHDLLGIWAPWLGVLVYGLGITVYKSAPRRLVGWLLFVLYAAWIAQMLGARLFGGYASGFIGALAMTIVAFAVERLPSGPPALVSFLPGFWLLVPGALGLTGLTDYLTSPQAAGPRDLFSTLAAVIAIALGVLCGYPIFQSISRFLPGTEP
jgi:uncharacterized membrane protein YjjP (DUF1212 family)